MNDKHYEIILVEKRKMAEHLTLLTLSEKVNPFANSRQDSDWKFVISGFCNTAHTIQHLSTNELRQVNSAVP
jgi:hypothetical protein